MLHSLQMLYGNLFQNKVKRLNKVIRSDSVTRSRSLFLNLCNICSMVYMTEKLQEENLQFLYRDGAVIIFLRL